MDIRINNVEKMTGPGWTLSYKSPSQALNCCTAGYHGFPPGLVVLVLYLTVFPEATKFGSDSV